MQKALRRLIASEVLFACTIGFGLSRKSLIREYEYSVGGDLYGVLSLYVGGISERRFFRL